LGIEVHTQVVLVPGLNDGQHLAQTVADLAALYQDPVASVGIVPIGLTKYHRGSCRPYRSDESLAILDQLEAWSAEYREQLGCSFVYPSDEWYLVSRREVPPAEMYDGFPQVENGVGMVRLLLDEATALGEELRAKRPALRAKSATWVCGTLIAPVLAAIVKETGRLTGADLRLVPVVNQFFGAVTTVSGLLTGVDVLAALRDQPLGEVVLLPRAMFTGNYGAGSASQGMTLDGMHIDDLRAHLGVRVEMAGTVEEVLEALSKNHAWLSPGSTNRPAPQEHRSLR
jgi:putative radical SAM enzyme (TIGR03279 family)